MPTVEFEIKDDRLHVPGLDRHFFKKQPTAGWERFQRFPGYLLEIAATELHLVRHHQVLMSDSDDLRPNLHSIELKGTAATTNKLAVIGSGREPTQAVELTIRSGDDSSFSRWPANVYALYSGWDVFLLLPTITFDEIAISCAEQRVESLVVQLYADMWLAEEDHKQDPYGPSDCTLYLPPLNRSGDASAHASVTELRWREKSQTLAAPWLRPDVEPTVSEPIIQAMEAIRDDLTVWRAETRRLLLLMCFGFGFGLALLVALWLR
jgi:hypothetical protein